VEFAEVDHCCQNFHRLDGWLQAEGLLRRGPVAHGMARLMQSRDIVRLATQKLAENGTIFLHPYGTDAECDLAWESIGTAQSSGAMK